MELIILILAAALIWGFFDGYLKGPKSEKATPSDLNWPRLGEFDFDIVGESHYQNELAVLAGDHGDESPENEYIANLVPESNNKHDKNAVRIDISGKTVGYLSRQDAPRFRRRLAQKGLQGVATSCPAIISGGFKMRDGTKAHYGVKLDLKAFRD